MIQCSYIKVTGGALIEINSISYATVPGGNTLEIIVENSAGTPVGVIAGNYVIADNTISINGSVVLYAAAESAFDIPVLDSALNPIGSLNMSDEFIIECSKLTHPYSSISLKNFSFKKIHFLFSTTFRIKSSMVFKCFQIRLNVFKCFSNVCEMFANVFKCFSDVFRTFSDVFRTFSMFS